MFAYFLSVRPGSNIRMRWLIPICGADIPRAPPLAIVLNRFVITFCTSVEFLNSRPFQEVIISTFFEISRSIGSPVV